MKNLGVTTGLPRLFIGSSTESVPLAEAIQANLAGSIVSTVWNQGAFRPGGTLIDVLERKLKEFDYAVLLLTPEAPAGQAGQQRNVPAGNLLVEAGLFLAHLGHDRTFLICPDSGIELPSDLAGLIFATFPQHTNGNARAVLAPACAEIGNAILRTGSKRPEVLLPGQAARRRHFDWIGTAMSQGPDNAMRIVNLSTSGAFLETAGPAPDPGERLELHLRLRGDLLVFLEAEVVRVQEPSWKKIGGVGVKFTGVNDAVRRTLQAFVEAGERAA
ncbi:MAG TPA: TIR domain-containing protein [Candidatus Polarisedimenticolaceae bacterium]|nr:TIR domain-containing protein [Candidatus Polarisedimenticolaceae bacterium]